MRYRKRCRYENTQILQMMDELKGTLVGLTDGHLAAIEAVMERELRYARSLAHSEGILAGMACRNSLCEKELEERRERHMDEFEPWQAEEGPLEGRLQSLKGPSS